MSYNHYVGQAREPKRRREECIYCRRLWYVSLAAEVGKGGYVCPKCDFKRKAGR